MKRTTFWGAAAALLIAAGAMTACSSDDDNNNGETVEPASVITLDNALVTHGVETDMQSAVVDVPVQCNGLWTAMLPASADWVQILDWKVTYSGSQTLRLAFDENHTKADRTTTLKIGNSYGELRSIAVRQNYTYNGEAPDNGPGLAFDQRGVGMGMDYDYALNVPLLSKTETAFDPTKVHLQNNIFNFSRIDELNDLPTFPYQWGTFTFMGLGMQVSRLDYCLTEDDFIGLVMCTPFGVVAREAKGEYNTKVQASRNYVDYTAVRSSSTGYIRLNPSVLAEYAAAHRQVDEDAAEAYYQEIEAQQTMYQRYNQKRKVRNLNENGLTEEQQEIINYLYDAIPVTFDHSGIYSAAFKKIYNQLYNALVRHSSAVFNGFDADEAMDALDEAFGPFFISYAEFGGSLTMHCQVSTSLLEGYDSFSYGLENAIEVLLYPMDEPYHAEEVAAQLPNIDVSFSVYGGNAAETLDGLQQTLIGGSAADVAKWPELLRTWEESILDGFTDDDDLIGNGAPVKFAFTPVWTLFAESAIRDYAREYFMRRYASRGIDGYIDIWRGRRHPSADELLNISSGFWQ